MADKILYVLKSRVGDSYLFGHADSKEKCREAVEAPDLRGHNLLRVYEVPTELRTEAQGLCLKLLDGTLGFEAMDNQMSSLLNPASDHP